MNLLSVVVTAYNQDIYISECIESVINQTYTNLEIIIVDDGSTDDTPGICDKYALLDKRVRVLHKVNEGSVSSRKAGMEVATGRYITFIDGDDWLEVNHYEKIMDSIDDSDIYAFGLTCIYDNNEKEIITNEANDGVYEGKLLEELIGVALYSGEFGKFGIFPSMCAKVFKRELIIGNLRKVDNCIRMGDDGACTFPSVCDAKKVIISNNITGYMYRKNISGTITSGYSYEEFTRIEKLYHVLKNAFIERSEKVMLEQLTYYLAFLFRIEMIYELSNLDLNSLNSKIKHVFEIKGMEWIRYMVSNVDLSKVDEETRLLIKNINQPMLLLINWYGKKVFNRFNSI